MIMLAVILIFFAVLGIFVFMAYRSGANRAAMAEREENSPPPED